MDNVPEASKNWLNDCLDFFNCRGEEDKYMVRTLLYKAYELGAADGRLRGLEETLNHIKETKKNG